MISRYTRPEMAALWSEQAKLSRMLEVELAACAALEAVKDSPIPQGTAARLRDAASAMGPLDPARIAKLEEETHHDVLAFLIHVEERLGEDARYLHFGLTSSDIIDTALGMQLRDAAAMILSGLDGALLPALAEKARAHAATPMIGRSHGIHAEPVTLGLLFAGSYAELVRARQRLDLAQKAVAVGKLAGAVGVYGSGGMSPEVEAAALGALGLLPETVATQVVARDRHAELFLSLSLLSAGIERLAMNLRHLQRTEVGEIEEAFRAGQKGSSAMPHKKNPISAENLCGLARLVRAEASAALENIALWHERDISHSSVERVIGPDVTTLADYMVQRAARLVAGLRVNESRLARNLGMSGGLYASEKVMLKLVQTGMTRRAAYELVQRHALAQASDAAERSGDAASPPPFYDRLAGDPAIRARLSEETLRACFDLSVHLRHVETIIERALS
jgi:adenylosuccinate lyase